MQIRDAAIELYQARTARATAHTALKNYREKNGCCEEETDHYEDSGKNPPCFRNQRLDRGEWCSICDGSQTLWEARKKASIRVAVALRRLMAGCRKKIGAEIIVK